MNILTGKLFAAIYCDFLIPSLFDITKTSTGFDKKFISLQKIEFPWLDKY